MECKRMEERILTDYIDGNLKGPALEEVESHLKTCASCRALASEVKAAGGLFKAASRENPPPYLWSRIRSGIEAGDLARVTFGEAVIERIRYSLAHLKPAVVMASAAVIALFILAAVRFAPYQDYAMQDEIVTMTYINGEDDDGYDFSTAAEEIFL